MQVYEEGTHIMIPWFERPIIYDVRARPNVIQSTSGSRDLQMVRFLVVGRCIIIVAMQCGDLCSLPGCALLYSCHVDSSVTPQVNIGLRVLTRPVPGQLPEIYRTLGTDYGERVLPSIIQVRVSLLACIDFEHAETR